MDTDIKMAKVVKTKWYNFIGDVLVDHKLELYGVKKKSKK